MKSQWVDLFPKRILIQHSDRMISTKGDNYASGSAGDEGSDKELYSHIIQWVRHPR